MSKERKVIEEMFSESNPDKAQRIFSDYVNSGYNIEEFINELKNSGDREKGEFTVISIFWLNRLNSMNNNNRFDSRNEEAVSTGSKVYNEIAESIPRELLDEYEEIANELSKLYDKEKEYYFEKYYYDYSHEALFVESMVSDHRTLQTAQTKIILRWLYNLSDNDGGGAYSEEIERSIKENNSEDYFRLF